MKDICGQFTTPTRSSALLHMIDCLSAFMVSLWAAVILGPGYGETFEDAPIAFAQPSMSFQMS